MTNHSEPHARPPLAADDPRISEWIDGRLTAAEAAEVERAVGESAALLRLVADLRAIKAAARLVPARSPSEGFVDRVMTAVAGPGSFASAGDAAADRVVEQEWQAIETERIAEERAEAEADLATEAGLEQSASRRAWPWLTVATALAAGLLVALVLNRPEEGSREIAKVTSDPELDRLEAASRRAAAPAAGAAAPPVAAPAAVAARQPARDEGTGVEKASQAKQADASALAAGGSGPADRALKLDDVLRQSEPQAAMAPAERGDGLAAGDAAVSEEAKADASVAAPDRPVMVTVESWTDFDRLLEAHGIAAQPLEGRAAADRADKQADWMLELSGPPARLDAFLAAAAGAGAREREAASAAKPARAAEENAAPAEAVRKRDEDAAPGGRGPAGRLLIRLVIREREPPAEEEGDKP